MELDLLGGGVLTAIVLAALGALLLVAAIGAYLVRQRRREEAPAGPVSRNPRLAVSETAIMPDGRRLVLLRRDNVEHLVLIGGRRDVVVESNIVRQRLAPTGPGQRPAAFGPVQPQAHRPIAAAGGATARSDGAPAAHAGAHATPERDQARAADPGMQERLRAASTALALRHAAAQPLQADRPAAEPDAGDSLPPPAGSAVAGLAAGVAALTAAAGSRARSGAPADAGEADAKTNGADAAANAEPQGIASEPGDKCERQAPATDAEPAAVAEGRAVYGLRGPPPVSTATDRPQAPESGEASDRSTVEPGGAVPPAPEMASEDLPEGSGQTADPGAGKATGAGEVSAAVTAAVAHPKESVSGRPPEAMPAAGAPAAEEASAAAPAEKRTGGALESAAEAVPASDDDGKTSGPDGPPPVPQAGTAHAEEHRTGTPAPRATLPVAPAAGPQEAPAPLSGFVPGRGTTLGDLAERLEEALIQQAATGGIVGPAQPGIVPADSVPASPAQPWPDEASAADRRLPETAERDEAAVIDFASRRKTGNESLEEEMARLLGELTRDTSSR